MFSQLSSLMLGACCLSLAAPASAVSLEAAKKRKDQCSGARTKLIWHIPLTLFTHWSRTRPLRGPGNALSLPIWIATYSRSNNTRWSNGPGISSSCSPHEDGAVNSVWRTAQPEVVPRQLLLWLLSQEPYPIYYLTTLLSSGIYN